jgi:enediyne biosynthesis protein E4
MTRRSLRRILPLASALALAAASCEPRGPVPSPASPPAAAPAGGAPAGAGTPGAASRPPPHPFTDITGEAGLRFRHETGGFGVKYLPETMGPGGALLDFDGDGRLDVFLVNADWWPGHEKAPVHPRAALFRSAGEAGKVRFEDVTEKAGVGKPLYGMGCAVADYDGDGRPDIYVTALGDNALYHNRGDGTFEDVAARAGVAGSRWKGKAGDPEPEWSTSAVFADLDLDGNLDLFVSHYVYWTTSMEIFTSLDGMSKAFTTPEGYRGCAGRLYLANGDGTFRDATEGSGIEKSLGKSLGMALWDFDGDGLPDIVIANDTQPNFFFHNKGGGRFEEFGLEAGIAYDSTGRARAGMGIDVADWANDGVPAVAIGNFSKQPLTLYRWIPGGQFEDIADRARLHGPTYIPLTFGLLFLDYDLDGRQDLVLANGHIEPEIRDFDRQLDYEQQPLLLRNAGDGGFDDVTDLAGPGFARKIVGRGLAAGDLDGDGDLDLLFTTCGGEPLLLRNDGPVPGGPGGPHYLRVRLRGKGKNTAALGAKVTLQAGGVTQVRMARTGSSYMSESEPALTFGLGKTATVDRLAVRWPLGKEEVVPVEAVDRTMEIREK